MPMEYFGRGYLFNEAYLKGQILYTQSIGHINLIYKKVLQNWRPMTLLKMDYKVLSKLLANRLRE